MKLFNKVSILFASLALVMGAGLVGGNDSKEVKAESQTVTISGGAKSTIKLSDANNSTVTTTAFKAGTSKKKGTLKLTIPKNSTKLSFYATAWSGSNSTIAIKSSDSSNTIVTAEHTLIQDSGVSGNGTTYTLSTTSVDTFLITTFLENITSDTTFTLTPGVNRFVAWGATVEFGSTKTITSLKSSGTLEKKTYQVGDKFDSKGLNITAVYDDDTEEDVTDQIVWPAITGDIKSSITGIYGRESITIDGIKVVMLSIVSDKTEMFEKETGSFSYNFKDTLGNDYDNIFMIEWKSSDKNKFYIDSEGNWEAKSVATGIEVTLDVLDNDNILYETSVTVNIKEKVDLKDGWNLLTDTSLLQVGSKIVIVSQAQNKIASNLSDDYLTNANVEIANNSFDSLPVEAMMFTIGGKAGAWTLENSDGELLGTTAAKTMVLNKGTTTWSINLDSNYNATIQSTTSSYGKILHNVNAKRFLNYTSGTSATMLLPQIYILGDTISQFEADWQTLRTAANNEGICHYLSKDNRAPLTALLKRYKAFSDADKAIIDAAKDGDTTIGNTIAYVTNVINNNQSTEKDYGINSGVIITSNYSIDSTSLIALFALLGIGAISAYYFIEKKKLSK